MADHVTAHRSLETAVHQSADVVSNYRHYVHYIGTSEDTPMFREKLHEARQHVGDLLKDISAEIEHEIHGHSKTAVFCHVGHEFLVSTLIPVGILRSSSTFSPSSCQAKNNVVDAKIVEEFGVVVREYRETERLEAEEEALHVPVAPQQANLLTSRDKNDEAGRNAAQDADLREPLDELKRIEALLLENENTLKEILRDEEENEEEDKSMPPTFREPCRCQPLKLVTKNRNQHFWIAFVKSSDRAFCWTDSVSTLLPRFS
ncbi:syntaxin-23-like [Rhodamnia argentea]|uniref:Syntaxin-23-like n=1 Tax=Rhodamnia argentea TaxID=178133 RepID=A0A8B8PH80_9MYRT|nr:syntaxin-23-like [Rhodamnia argentea]